MVTTPLLKNTYLGCFQPRHMRSHIHVSSRMACLLFETATPSHHTRSSIIPHDNTHQSRNRPRTHHFHLLAHLTSTRNLTRTPRRPPAPHRDAQARAHRAHIAPHPPDHTRSPADDHSPSTAQTQQRVPCQAPH